MEPYISIYKDVLTNKYAEFEGRADRQEFWSFVLVNFLISVVLGIIGGIIHSDLLGNLYSLAVLIPSLAVGARRLHDINKSGWWQLLCLIPIIGWIILIVWAATKGDGATNTFGNPPTITAAPITTTPTEPTTPTPPTPPTTPNE